MRSKNNIVRHERVLDAFSVSLLRRGSTYARVRVFMLKKIIEQRSRWLISSKLKRK